MRVKNIKGSSLLAVLIFAFVVMVVISALAYNFNINSLSVRTQIDQTENINVHEGYFSNVIGSADLSKDSEETIGQFKFITTLDSITPGFDFMNANVTLYNSTPYLISYRLRHQFLDNNINRYSRDFIFNILPNITMSQYEETIIPLNLPYINIDAMSDSLKDYKLGLQDNKIAIYGGYIGYIKKPLFNSGSGSSEGDECDAAGTSINGSCETSKHEHKTLICHVNEGNGNGGSKVIDISKNGWAGHAGHDGDYRGTCHDNPSEKLVINAYGNSLNIGFPKNISLDDYRISVGWGLIGGEWNFYLAIYDYDRVYTSTTTLSNLRENASAAELGLSNWQEVGGLSVGDGDILSVRWYYDNAKDVPKPLILEEFPSVVNNSYSGDYKISLYKTISSNNVYTASEADTYTIGNQIVDKSKIHISIPDALFTLSPGTPLIFEQKNVLDFNLEGNYLLGDGTDSTKATLTAEVSDDPILVKKNTTQFYIIYFNADTVYIYLYSRGVSAPTLISKDSFSGEVIQKLIVKFGALFIVTDKKIYVEDISSRSLISSVSIYSGSKFQISRDGDGKIYAMSNGLQCNIDNNCNNASRIYLDTGCSAYPNGCEAMAKLNSVVPHLNVVYKSFEH
ncbi:MULTISPECIES: hypothetical protein [unclassified Francisella]|uniref:hypothetical protein n=1 Tax=unclassified Francisella TaxID=2610885 RepID=UPI002E36D11B|nr:MULTISPECIES: hypothetical protein [unclassified Francisella]MED7818777.1 hypothetical protein [Francisella sp. 19S2-4]MED7829613.1 hypothetical protein [Francisella sp. 19S2-10]